MMYPVRESEKKRKEIEIIKNILHNNQYMTNLLIRKAKKKGNNTTQIIKNSTHTKWLTVAYAGKQTKLLHKSLRIEA